ncbi:MAG: hypothetical protein WCJ86_02180 [Candidatus Saccharibacteria bacterium]
MTKQTSKHPNTLTLKTAKAKKSIGKNKLIYLGLALWVYILMLFTGSYAYVKYSNRQANQGNTTLENKTSNDSSNIQGLNPVTSQPTTQNNKSKPSIGSANSTPISSPSTSKPYVPFSCIKTPIPYETEYVNTIGLYVGETTSIGGYDGYKSTCTLGSTNYKPDDYTIEPIIKTVYIGTAVKPTSGSSASELEAARQQRIANCIQYMKRLSGGSNAYLQCNYID